MWFVAVCNAGLSIPGYFLDQRPEDFKKQMDVNYLGCVHAVQGLSPLFFSLSLSRFVCVLSVCVEFDLTTQPFRPPSRAALYGQAEPRKNLFHFFWSEPVKSPL